MKKIRFWAWAAFTVVVFGMSVILYLLFRSNSTDSNSEPSAKTELPNLSELAAVSPIQANRLSKLYFLADFYDSESPIIWLERFQTGETVEVREQPNSRGMRLVALKVSVHSRLGVAYVEYGGKIEEFRSDFVEDLLVESSTLIPGEPEPAIPEGLTEPVMAAGLTDPVYPEGLAEPLYNENLPAQFMPEPSQGY